MKITKFARGCIIFMIVCLALVVFEYYSLIRISYNKYLSGDYYFREVAHTVNIHKNDNWWATGEAQEKDYSDPRNLLMISDGWKVYVSKPHDGFCTVIYGKDTVIEDFPLANLQLETEDTGYFYGTKKYSRKEYIKVLSEMTKEQKKSLILSDKRMAKFTGMKWDIIRIIAIEIGVFFVCCIFYKHEIEFAFNLTLALGAGYTLINALIAIYAN